MRFHVVGLPHTQTTREFAVCAYTQKVRKFCRMMRERGHTVYLYAAEHSDATCCDELVQCISERERENAVGDRHYVEASFDSSAAHWQTFNGNAIAGILERAQSRDFLCVIAGVAHKPIADALPHMMAVEFGIGYGGTFAPYRVYESYAWMHVCYGSSGRPHDLDGRWFDAVIPNYFETEDFPDGHDGGAFLYLGRLVDRKGFRIAVDVCRSLRAGLTTAGPGIPPDYGTHEGTVGAQRRGELLSQARAVFVPTHYLEPFGGVAVEAMLCGTPVITTDWGAFPENVEQGVTGFRCRTLAEFKQAALDVTKLDRAAIRAKAQARWSLEAVAPQYERYFERLSTVWGAGWYAR